MNDQTIFLALDGPGHLQLVELKDGQTTFEMAVAPRSVLSLEAEPAEHVVQTFTYRKVRVGMGSHSPVGFLIPAHLEGEPKHLAGWVFNKLVQGLMGTHPMGGRVLLRLDFVVKDRITLGYPERVFTAQAFAHPIGTNGVARLAPLTTNEHNHAIDHRGLVLLADGQGFLRSVLSRLATRALEPYVNATVDQVLSGGESAI